MNDPTDINDPVSLNDSVTSDASADSREPLPSESEGEKSARGGRRMRFSLLDLLLLTFAVAAWLPTVFARREIPGLVNDVEQMRALTTHLPIIDANQLCLRKLPTIWHNIYGWKYYLPPDAAMELRFATEGINSLGDPNEFQTAPLPAGVHTVHLKYTDTQEGFVSTVYLDEQAVLTKTHPPDWKESGGSTSNGFSSATAEAHPVDEQLLLRRMQYSAKNPQQKFSSVSTPSEYDAKGNYLAIAPASRQVIPAGDFVPSGDKGKRLGWGHRQGMRIKIASNSNLSGTIAIEPNFYVPLETDVFGYERAVNALSVRPITADTPEGEVPELLTGGDRFRVQGLKLTVTDSLSPPSVGTPQSETPGVFDDQKRTMRVFVHFEAFPSGAKPILEVIFDRDHPNRLGVVPHQAEDSVEIQAIELVSVLESLTLMRQLKLLPTAEVIDAADEPAEPQWVALNSLLSDASKQTPWRDIPSARLPIRTVLGDQRHRVFELTTDVDDFSKLQFSSTQWEYSGLPLAQTWYLPAREGTGETPSLSIRANTEYRLPRQQGATGQVIPGGAAIENVRVRIPLPAEQPVWWEIRSKEWGSEGEGGEGEGE